MKTIRKIRYSDTLRQTMKKLESIGFAVKYHEPTKSNVGWIEVWKI